MKPGVPEGWGLKVLAGSKPRAKVKAPRLTPEPLTLDFIAGLPKSASTGRSSSPVAVYTTP